MLILVAYIDLYALRVIPEVKLIIQSPSASSTQVSQFMPICTKQRPTCPVLSMMTASDVANLDQDGWNDLEWMKSVYHLQETFPLR